MNKNALLSEYSYERYLQLNQEVFWTNGILVLTETILNDLSLRELRMLLQTLEDSIENFKK